MKIAFRPSGGRGEYELAGSQGKTSAVDLANFTIDFQISPLILVPGRCILRIKNGKPRLRLTKEDKDEAHIQRWLSALLLMPEPNRTLASSGYQITNIQVDIATTSKQHCVLRPTALEMKRANIAESISIPDRIGRIQIILDNVSRFPSAIQDTILKYGEALAQPISHTALERLRKGVYDSLTSADEPGDALVALEGFLENQSTSFDKSEVKPKAPKQHGEEDNRSAIEIRSDYLRAWRLVAERGSQGRIFSRGVIEAYDYRCILSGIRLPKTSINPIPGVDAAHILPWAKYDLNKIPNGLCLTKTYHWAFDSGILRIIFDHSENWYIAVMDEEIRMLLAEAGCDLFIFEPCLGVIPKSRLPAQERLWPSPTPNTKKPPIIPQVADKAWLHRRG